LDDKLPVTPAQRFRPVPETDRTVIDLWLPPALQSVESVTDNRSQADHVLENESAPEPSWAGGPVELDRVVPASGNMQLCGKQFWLGPARSGQVVRFWADVDMIHLLIGGARVKTVRSHLTVKDLAGLVAEGAVNAGPSPLPPIEDGAAMELERSIGSGGITSLGGKVILAAEILAGRRVGITDRTRHVDVLRPGHPRTAADPAQPTDRRPGDPVARTPTGRTTTQALGRADPGATQGLQGRHHQRPFRIRSGSSKRAKLEADWRQSL
jgi:hypothetical protein